MWNLYVQGLISILYMFIFNMFPSFTSFINISELPSFSVIYFSVDFSYLNWIISLFAYKTWNLAQHLNLGEYLFLDSFINNFWAFLATRQPRLHRNISEKWDFTVKSRKTNCCCFTFYHLLDVSSVFVCCVICVHGCRLEWDLPAGVWGSRCCLMPTPTKNISARCVWSMFGMKAFIHCDVCVLFFKSHLQAEASTTQRVWSEDIERCVQSSWLYL